MSNLFIFSNDLRLDDNAALYQSSLSKKGLTTAFIFNPKKWEDHNDSPLKIKFQLKTYYSLFLIISIGKDYSKTCKRS